MIDPGHHDAVTDGTTPQLITYVDRLAGDLVGLAEILDGPVGAAFGGVHLLPFYDPIDGADAGFDPDDHTAVDPRLGTWADVGRIGAHGSLMADLIVNHVSARSPRFVDWLEKGADSEFDGMFLTEDRVFPDGANEADRAAIYRPRPGLPFTTYTVAGEERQVWTTFTDEQIDIDVDHPAAWAYLIEVLDRFAEAGVDIVRLDAVGYAIKKAGTSCFMLPETFDFIGRLGEECHARGIRVLVEIHSHHQVQLDIARQVDLVYDFALPPLVLHALHTGEVGPLRTWIDMRPTNCVTVLDTHDGIGVIDVASEGDKPGLLPDSAIDALVEAIHDVSGGESRQATGAAASNVDLYQVNCTWHSALGCDDGALFISRLIQAVLPGIPQAYYAGLLAEPNDMALLAATNVGRDINRPYLDRDDRLVMALERPVVGDLLALLAWRTRHDELFGGEFELLESPAGILAVHWTLGDRQLDVSIDVGERSFELTLDGRTATSAADLGDL